MKYLFRVYFLSIIFVFLSDSAAAYALHIFPKGDKPNGFIYILLVAVAVFISLAVHEMGHLLTGLFQGFRLHLFVVGLLGVKRNGDTIKVYLNTNIGYMGGVAATIPHVQSRDNRKKFARIVLAGPIASLLFCLISAAMFHYSISGIGRGFWLIASVSSFSTLLATTLPKKTGIYFSDRARFFRLINKGRAGDAEEALLNIITQSTIDNSARNINISQARLLQSDTEVQYRFWGHYYEYQFYKDNSLNTEANEAHARLLILKPDITPALWKALNIEG